MDAISSLKVRDKAIIWVTIAITTVDETLPKLINYATVTFIRFFLHVGVQSDIYSIHIQLVLFSVTFRPFGSFLDLQVDLAINST